MTGHRNQSTYGFTLIEMLISLAILGILMLTFTQIFGSTFRAAAGINGRNELVNEGQIAQQIIAARLQSAVYIYPTSTTFQLTSSGASTINTVRSGAGQNWIVGTDPILAMVLPPEVTGTCTSALPRACFTFYAYYPYKRGSFISNASLATISKPPADSTNDDQWLLLEYKKNIYDSVNRPVLTAVPPVSPATRANVVNWFNTVLSNAASVSPNMKSGSGTLLTDYIQPSNVAPTYTMFTVDTTSSLFNVTVNLRMLQMRGGRELRAPAMTTSTPLSTRVYPRNWF